MKITRLVLGALETNCYLVYADNGEGILIDPADEADIIMDAVQKENVSVKAVVLTHGHFDHMLAARAVCSATGALLCVGAGDVEALSDPNRNLSAWFSAEHPLSLSYDCILHEGDTFSLGEESLTVMETPGHSPGCICLYTEGLLFSGDTLFRNSIGRLDFPGGDPLAMRRSLERLVTLPAETAVYSGHGPATTIACEIKRNPYLQ